MIWREYSAVTQPDTLVVESVAGVTGRKLLLFLRLGAVRGSSRAETRIVGSSGTAGQSSECAATRNFNGTQREHGARAASEPPSTLQLPTSWSAPSHPLDA